MANKQGSDPLEQYLLKVDGKPVSIAGKFWKTDGIYLSDVCLAVVLTPTPGSTLKEPAKAKEELYGLLRGISIRALHHDLMRPLAAFVRGVDDPELASWGANQDWHRGAFTLYIEDSQLTPEPGDLLVQQSPLFQSTDFRQRHPAEVLAAATEGYSAATLEVNKFREELEAIMDPTKAKSTEERRQETKVLFDTWWRDNDPERQPAGQRQ